MPTKEQISEALRLRNMLTKLFSQYDEVAKMTALLELSTDTERIVQRNITYAARNFLQTNMLPLKSLPAILRQLKNKRVNNAQTHSPSSSVSSSQIIVNGEIRNLPSLSEQEVTEYKSKLIVLEEQRYLVGNMLTEAKARRRFEEVKALEESMYDLDNEISSTKHILGE